MKTDHVEGYEKIKWKPLLKDPEGYAEFSVVGSPVTERLCHLVKNNSEFWDGYFHKVVESTSAGEKTYIKRRKG